MIRVRAPATSANLASGFDIFGLALSEPADRLTVEATERTTIEVSGLGADTIPADPEANIAGIVADLLDVTAAITIEKGIRPSSGLGSSGASAAGAVVALHHLYDLGLDSDEQVAVAAEAEGEIAGEAHADNVAAAIHGGFVIATGQGTLSFDVDLSLVVCLPDISVSTEDARTVLPASVSLRDHVEAIGNASTLVTGMVRSDPTLVGSGMADAIVTPHRAPLVPRFDAVCAAARDAGAEGVALSGAGPALLSVCHPADQEVVAAAMRNAFADGDIQAIVWQTTTGDGIEIQ